MRRLLPVITACILLIVIVFTVRAGATYPAATTYPVIYSPIYTSALDTVWKATDDGSPVWAVRYVKQPDQTEFKMCGLFNGDGDVLLSWPESGDGIEFHYDQPTPLCVITLVGRGGSGMPLVLNVHMSQRGKRPASVEWPNIFVGSQVSLSETAR